VVDEESFDKEKFRNKFHEKICKQVDRWSADYEVANDFTDWIKAIQKADIVELGSEDPWTDNKDLIQVRRMTAKELESQVDLPESKHEYEDTLDVIKLPLPMPIDKRSPAPQFLFVRPDEYALFKCFTKHDWCILTGNLGISKSWFQWKFILFCYRLDLFDKFSPFKEKLLGGLKSEDKKSAEQEQVISSETFIPKLIVRTEAGSKSLYFFVGLDADVLFVKHDIDMLDCITDENTTILWEPRESSTQVYYSCVNARIIATVPPNKDLIHEFKKEAKMFFMPCPSELQIRLMGQIYRRFATQLRNCPSDAVIHERVHNFGPFIRTALCWSSDQLERFINNRQEEIGGIDPTKLKSRIEITDPATGKCLSDRSVLIVVHRNSTSPFLGYTAEHYEFS